MVILNKKVYVLNSDNIKHGLKVNWYGIVWDEKHKKEEKVYVALR